MAMVRTSIFGKLELQYWQTDNLEFFKLQVNVKMNGHKEFTISQEQTGFMVATNCVKSLIGIQAATSKGLLEKEN